jgi:hypothetical protein
MESFESEMPFIMWEILSILLPFSFKLKRKKQVAPEKPVKKQKSGETSRALASSKQSSSSRDDNMFQVKLVISLHIVELLSLV